MIYMKIIQIRATTRKFLILWNFSGTSSILYRDLNIDPFSYEGASFEFRSGGAMCKRFFWNVWNRFSIYIFGLPFFKCHVWRSNRFISSKKQILLRRIRLNCCALFMPGINFLRRQQRLLPRSFSDPNDSAYYVSGVKCPQILILSLQRATSQKEEASSVQAHAFHAHM